MATTVASRIRLTWDDYGAFPEDGQRHEIIDGEHYVAASPFLNHQSILANLLFQLYSQINEHRRGSVFRPCSSLRTTCGDLKLRL